MAPYRLITLLLAMTSVWALAQTANPYDGTWKVKFDGTRTVDYEGTVVVQGDGGSWKVLARSQSNPCIGREAPISVHRATAEELVFEVNRSKVLTGCRDWTMSFQRVDDKTLRATTSDGRPMLMVRE
jgi:hypothetical protein